MVCTQGRVWRELLGGWHFRVEALCQACGGAARICEIAERERLVLCSEYPGFARYRIEKLADCG